MWFVYICQVGVGNNPCMGYRLNKSYCYMDILEVSPWCKTNDINCNNNHMYDNVYLGGDHMCIHSLMCSNFASTCSHSDQGKHTHLHCH